MFPLNDETRFILGLPNFRTGPMAHRLRELGHDIKTKCEDEQAYAIHWMLTLLEEHGAEWRNVAANYLARPTAETPKPLDPNVNGALNNDR